MYRSSNLPVKKPCSDFFYLRTLFHFADVDAIHGGLDEDEEAGQRIIIRHSKSIMRLEELIKGSNWGLHPAGNGLLVQDDVEVLDAVASFSDTEKKGLFGANSLAGGHNYLLPTDGQQCRYK